MNRTIIKTKKKKKKEKNEWKRKRRERKTSKRAKRGVGTEEGKDKNCHTFNQLNISRPVLLALGIILVLVSTRE